MTTRKRIPTKVVIIVAGIAFILIAWAFTPIMLRANLFGLMLLLMFGLFVYKGFISFKKGLRKGLAGPPPPPPPVLDHTCIWCGTPVSSSQKTCSSCGKMAQG
jgi:hypothetical protein